MASKPKSVAVSNELFLLSCINHAMEGKINFKIVAEECGMPTPAAAAMRFRRFKEKHTPQLGANSNGGGSGNDSPAKTNREAADAKKQKNSTKKSPNKKRKLDADSGDETGVKKEEELEDIF